MSAASGRPQASSHRSAQHDGTPMSPTVLAAAAPCMALPGVDIIPQRAPFRYLDEIDSGVPGVFAVSRFQVRSDDPVLVGHFPGRPVFPGVLMIEQMAQTACWVMAARPQAQPSDQYVLVRVSECSFQRLVQPGDELLARADLNREVGGFAFFSCTLHCAGHSVARAQLLVALRQPLPNPGTAS